MGLVSYRLPAAPMHTLIRRAAIESGGIKELGRQISIRYGKEVRYGERELHKILAREDVTFGSADRICSALGTHVGLLYGWQTYFEAS